MAEEELVKIGKPWPIGPNTEFLREEDFGNGSAPPFCAQEKLDKSHRLLHTIAQMLRLHQMFDQSEQNLRKCAARLASGYQVDVERWENSRKIS